MMESQSKGRARLLRRDRVALNPEAVHVAASPPKSRGGQSPEHVRAEPEIIPIRAEDGTIEMITVRCTCGRDIHISCDYLDEGGKDEKKGD